MTDPIATAPCLELTLPWPPTLNTYWRHVGRKVLISEAGRAYRVAVASHVLLTRGRRRDPWTCALDVSISARMPDHRARDVDNLLKAPLDGLTHARVWKDDAQIERLTITKWWPPEKLAGQLAVTIKPLTPALQP